MTEPVAILATARNVPAALAFASAIDNFGVPALLGIAGRHPVLSTLIYQRLSGFGPTALPKVAAQALETVGLAGFQPRRVQSLSGGQRQRVAMALAPGGIPARLLSDRRIGARHSMTLAPQAAPDLHLRLDLPCDSAPDPTAGLILRDGWVIGPGPG